MFGKASRETLQPQRLDYLNEGLALERQGDYEAALTSYRLAFRDNPSDSRILLNMAIAFTKTGQPEEAIRHYKRALELDPSLVGAHYGVAFLLLKRGDRPAGRRTPAGVPRPPAEGSRRRPVDPPRGERPAGHRRQPRAGDAVRRRAACCRCSRWRRAAVSRKVQGGVVALEIQTPTTTTLEVGEQVQLSARALDADGETVDAAIEWRTSSAALSVDAAGLVTGVTAGAGRGPGGRRLADLRSDPLRRHARRPTPSSSSATRCSSFRRPHPVPANPTVRMDSRTPPGPVEGQAGDLRDHPAGGRAPSRWSSSRAVFRATRSDHRRRARHRRPERGDRPGAARHRDRRRSGRTGSEARSVPGSGQRFIILFQ